MLKKNSLAHIALICLVAFSVVYGMTAITTCLADNSMPYSIGGFFEPLDNSMPYSIGGFFEPLDNSMPY